MVINNQSGFTMGNEPFLDASEKAVCVSKSTPLFEPKTWTITNDKHKDKRLLVFSLLQQNASFLYNGEKLLLKEHPNGPHCELFIRFDLNDYSLLFVDTSSTTTAPITTTTATTTKAPKKETTSDEATTDLFSSSTTTLQATTESSSNRTTSRTTTKCPKSQEECSGGLYILGIGLIAVSLCICVIAILVWLCMKDKAGKEKKAAEKQEAERGGDERLQALYKAEAKIKGPKKIGTFSAWKKDRKENETKTAMGLPSIEDEIAAMWKKVEKEKANDKMQYLGEQFMKQRDKQLLEREYQPELKMKGLKAVGSFEDWKKKKNIATTFTLTDGTRTAIEYEEPKVVEKVIIETVKADEFTLEEKDHLPLSGEEEGVSVPKSEEDIRDIPIPVDDTPKITLDI
uniref:AJAP1_PANP_C domain-containing protein n=1 Tax=Meloidogyne hapla TaxID=6305 RepID=A0A1I8BTS4_MELHA